MSSNIPELQTIPGPRGYLLVGIIPQLARNPFQFMVEAARTYGGVVRLTLGSTNVYLVSDPDYIKHILVDHHTNYWKGPILRGLKLIIGDGLFASDGAPWQHQRRLMSPSFHRLERACELLSDAEEIGEGIPPFERPIRSDRTTQVFERDGNAAIPDPRFQRWRGQQRWSEDDDVRRIVTRR